MNLLNIQDAFEKSLAEISDSDANIVRQEISKLSPDQLAILQKLYNSSASDEVAYELIGQSMGNGAWGTDAIKAGKKLIQKYKSQLQHSVCGNKVLQKYCEKGKLLDSNNGDYLITVSAIIASNLTSSLTGGLDIISIAFLLTKMVGNGLCATHWHS